MFGRDFERYREEDEVEEAPKAAKAAKEDVTKFNAKKGKAAASPGRSGTRASSGSDPLLDSRAFRLLFFSRSILFKFRFDLMRLGARV